MRRVLGIRQVGCGFLSPGRFTDEPAGEAGVRAKGLATSFGHCREIDARLAGRDWFLDRFSAVDCYGFVFWGWGGRAGLPMHELRNLAAHKDRMLARPAVRRVLTREGIAVA